MVTGSTLLSLLISLVIAGCIFALLWWLITQIPLPEPFMMVARVVIGLAAVIFLIDLLMGLNGHPLIVR